MRLLIILGQPPNQTNQRTVEAVSRKSYVKARTRQSFIPNDLSAHHITAELIEETG